MQVSFDASSSIARAPRIRVLIADDDEVARALIAGLLESEPSLDLVAAAKDTDEAIALALEHRPDVALLDLDMPGAGGWKAAEVIREKSPHTQTIALTALDTAEAEYQSMRAGAVSVLKKGSPKSQIIDAIESAARWRQHDVPADVSAEPTEPTEPGRADALDTGPEPRLIDVVSEQAERLDALERRLETIERSLGL